jgi:hypothetical protein
MKNQPNRSILLFLAWLSLVSLPYLAILEGRELQNFRLDFKLTRQGLHFQTKLENKKPLESNPEVVLPKAPLPVTQKSTQP